MTMAFFKTKAQHEIVGFVLIVIIVSVIGLIFLSLSIGRGEQKSVNTEISDFLKSSMYYTTDCAVNYIPQYKELQDLIKICYDNPIQRCLDGRSICQAREEILDKLITKSLDINPDSPNKAYKLNIYYKQEEVQDEELLKIEKGNFTQCNSRLGGSHLIAGSSFDSGIIEINLEVCKS